MPVRPGSSRRRRLQPSGGRGRVRAARATPSTAGHVPVSRELALGAVQVDEDVLEVGFADDEVDRRRAARSLEGAGRPRRSGRSRAMSPSTSTRSGAREAVERVARGTSPAVLISTRWTARVRSDADVLDGCEHGRRGSCRLGRRAGRPPTACATTAAPSLPRSVTSREARWNSACISGSSPLVGSSRTSSSGSAHERLRRCRSSAGCRGTASSDRSGEVETEAFGQSIDGRDRSTPPRRNGEVGEDLALRSVAPTGQVAGEVPDPSSAPRRIGRCGCPHPRSRMRSGSARISPTRRRIVVVLPAPFGPRKPNTSPSRTASERSVMPPPPP